MSRGLSTSSRGASRVNPVELIIKTRDGLRLLDSEIHGLVSGFLSGRITDYQMSAWLMAAFLRGLSESETVALTSAMLHSGTVLDLRSVDAPKVDKHSTGGVGDKISICLAPLVAACGVAVPMVAGRGLGHTGGTLDKLESIPGYSVALDTRRFARILREIGVSIIGQTEELAPADRRIYALRDVTGTVESIPLIVASILSKKLAAGIDGLVLDVKCGPGAFMKDLASAERLARALVRAGRRAGKTTVALVTDMTTPIGRTIGNALEVREAIAVLEGEGPEDTRQLTFALGTEMLLAAQVSKNAREARLALERAITSGAALERFARLVRAHGGDERVVHDTKRLPKTRHKRAVLASRAGYVHACDALELGLTAVLLGAGRMRADEPVDPAVGIELCVKPGERVDRGQPLAMLHARNPSAAQALLQRARRAFRIGPAKPKLGPLLIERIAR